MTGDNLLINYADGTNLPPTADTHTLVSPVSRGPFESYLISPSRSGDLRPRISTLKQYALTDITGYQGAHNLPGNPV